MTDIAAPPRIADDELAELLELVRGADSVELKVTVPEPDRRFTMEALGMDPIDAQYNYLGRDRFELQSPEAVPDGRHALRYEFEPTGAPDFKTGKGVPGRAQLYVDGRLVANAEFPHTVPFLFELEGLSCGYDFGAPVSEGYEPPFAFNGTIHSVTFDVSGELIADDEAELARMMAQQ
jgi:hypothetical protein